MPRLKLLKPAIAKLTPFFLLALSCSLSVVAPLPTPIRLSAHVEAYSPLPASAQTADARKAEADRLLNQGLQQYQTSRYQTAIQSYEKALALYRSMPDRNGEATALNNLGNTYRSLSQYHKAIAFCQQALSIFRQVGDRNGEAASLTNLGIAYDSLSQTDKAIDFLQQALPLSRNVGDRTNEAKTLNSLGIAYRSRSQYGKAIAYYQQARLLYRQVENRIGEASTLNNLGSTHRFLSQYGKAIEYYQQALPLYRQVGNRNGEAWALNNLGDAYRSLSQYGRAIEYHQQALPIFQQVGDRNGEIYALNFLGIAYAALSQYSKAIEYYQQALPIAHQMDNPNGEGWALNNLGDAYRSLSQYRKAIQYHRQALSLLRQIGNRNGEAKVLNNLGDAVASLSQPNEAIQYYQQALSISRGASDRNGEAWALNNLGNASIFLSQYNKAIQYYQQALPLFRQVGDRSGEGLVLNNSGYAAFKTKAFPTAEKTLLAAITVWESLRPGLNDENKVSLFESQASTYRTLQQTLIAQNQFIPALEIAERGRARAFVELLAQRLSSSSLSSISAPGQAQIRQIARAQNATLVQYSIIYDDFQIQGKPSVRESALYIWVIRPTGEITFRTVDLKSLRRQHNASLADLTIGNQEFLAVRNRSIGVTKSQPNLPTLHQLLIDPIANLLPKDPNAHVIFIPQGSLFQVPFPALQDANGTYLIQKHTILTAPSIQVLALTQQERQRQTSQDPQSQSHQALVVGNPTMPSASLTPGEAKQPLSPLPGAEAEAKAIAPILNTQAILGAQATKAAIMQKMTQASMIHLATHGLLDDVRGLGSAIALAPSGDDNGWLTAEEILDMKLHANLVVLSACNTAEGRITGDGVIGLSRSLISAGVPSVIVSLWSVPDAPTAELMQTFYQNLQKNSDKAQALRQAMLTTMKTHPEPRDWAAFALIGEAN